MIQISLKSKKGRCYSCGRKHAQIVRYCSDCMDKDTEGEPSMYYDITFPSLWVSTISEKNEGRFDTIKKFSIRHGFRIDLVIQRLNDDHTLNIIPTDDQMEVVAEMVKEFNFD